MWLWTDYCTVDNESLPILIICLKHSKTIEIVSLSDRLKIVIFEDVQIQFHCGFFYVGIPSLQGKIWKISSDSNQIWQIDASNHCLCVLQIS